jgi:hypothetical protein
MKLERPHVVSLQNVNPDNLKLQRPHHVMLHATVRDFQHHVEEAVSD